MEKQKTQKNTDVVTLKDGQHIKMNGQEFIVEANNFKLVPPDHKDIQEEHFYIYFNGSFAKDVKNLKEVNGCKFVKVGHKVAIDILPLVKELFGSSYSVASDQLSGIEYVNGNINNVECRQMTFGHREENKIRNKLDRMLDMSVVNQKQLSGYKSYIDEIFYDLWSELYRDF